MAKRNPRSEADDAAMAAPAGPAKERRARPRTTKNGAAAPAISDTQAARPTIADITPPADTIAAHPDVLEANHVEQGAEEPTVDQIREHAYGLYLARGGQHGLHEDDWYRAEQELRRKQK